MRFLTRLRTACRNGWQSLRRTDWKALLQSLPGRAKAQWIAFKARPPRQQRWIIGIAVLIVVALLTLRWFLHSEFNPFQRGRPPTPVAVATVYQGVFPVVVDGLGTVTSRRTVTIRTQVDGRLDQVLFSEGQIVKAGDVLAVVDPRPYQAQVTQAEGKLAQDKSQLRNARLILERYQVLYKQDSVARQDLDTQAALVKQYEGLVETDQGALDNAKVQLSYTKIVAPFDGRLGLRLVDAGNIVKAGEATSIVTITQIRPIDVLLTLPSDKLPPILARFNAGAAMVVKAYDRSYKTVLASGVLKSIDNQIDTTTGMVKLKAEFTNDDNSLFPNQFVNAQLAVEDHENAILVSANAILRGAQGTYVYVVDAQNTVSARPVKLGGTNDQVVEVLDGLAVGESVVIDGFDKLKPGMKVMVPARGQGSGNGYQGAGNRDQKGGGAPNVQGNGQTAIPAGQTPNANNPPAPPAGGGQAGQTPGNGQAAAAGNQTGQPAASGGVPSGQAVTQTGQAPGSQSAGSHSTTQSVRPEPVEGQRIGGNAPGSSAAPSGQGNGQAGAANASSAAPANPRPAQ